MQGKKQHCALATHHEGGETTAKQVHTTFTEYCSRYRFVDYADFVDSSSFHNHVVSAKRSTYGVLSSYYCY